MKNVFKLSIVTLTLTAASSVFAYVETSAPTIQFQGTKTSYSNICLSDSSEIRTKNKVQMYKRVNYGRRGIVRVPTVKKFLFTPVDYVKEVCVKKRYARGERICLETETRNLSHPLDYVETKVQVRGGGDRTFRKIISETVKSVPYCN